ncbi:alpha-(1,3)-fucosyltransferase C-like isoform X5 [Nymphalis io]|uniref:alpha-(1,3)-fucosyltransferase C-like isoform X4 n=1 Tax=Inachis io TaxID=171585 RepID=UPI002166D302|nr:alpha-(1,3)-fucosyltransferase C-like isoform X4 [Nymphalis io]XP_050355593.1 alpha-(1,3)-fucosyltransferase C-like isoform X5 [Nymphalis io]
MNLFIDINIKISSFIQKYRQKTRRKQKLTKLFEHDAKKMPRCISLRLRLLTSLRQLLSIRSLLIITCISFTISFIWIQLVEKDNLIIDNESLVNEALENVARDHRYAEVYRKVDRLQKDVKYILLWTPHNFAPFYYFGDGQRAFIDKNCSNINCYVTSDRNFFHGDTSKFDAIAFNGRNIDTLTKSQLPKVRSQRQKFIYFNMESADNYPVCDDMFDGFFNWTSTYRLDSDIPYPYIQIRNSNGEIVGPREKMNWVRSNTLNDEYLQTKLQNKSKAVAWFVSHCSSRSGRREYANQLRRALRAHGLTLDIYGACGPLKCPRNRKNSCDSILESDYFFYLSFENSLAKDYVTEKLLTALQHDSVPIVLGGADYSRFLPPGSYLNARSTTPTALANMIAKLMLSKEYYQFFLWKSSYTYYDPTETNNVCAVCAALHNKEMFETPSVYRKLRRWWHPNYDDRCYT